MGDKKMKSFDSITDKISREKEAYTTQIDGLRKGAATMICELRPVLVSGQEGALLCSAMELIGPGAGTPRGDKLLGQSALNDLLPSDPQLFKLPNAPAHDLRPLKLVQLLQTLHKIVFDITTQLLLTSSDLHVARKQIAAAKSAKQEIPTPLVLDSDFIAARNTLLESRELIQDLRTFTVEPKHPQVVKAFLYVMGGNRKKLDKWADMKKQLGPDMFRNVFLLDPETQKFGSSLKEAWNLISNLEEDEILANSEAVGCLYKVVKGLVISKEKAAAKEKAAVDAGES